MTTPYPFAIAAVLLAGCSGTASAPNPPLPEVAETLPTELDGESLYRLGTTLEDASGRRFDLAALRGHPVLLTFFYASCTTMCPTIVHDVRDIESGLTGSSRDALRVVFVTFDGTRDTPERLAEVMRERQLDATRWTLARGDEGSVRALASTLGVAYRRTRDGEFAHNAVVTILDHEGRVRFQRDGTGLEPGPVRAAIESTVTTTATPR